MPVDKGPEKQQSLTDEGRWLVDLGAIFRNPGHLEFLGYPVQQ